MSKNTKIYAVRIGRMTGIFMTWSDAKKQVDGYPGAKYKSFPRGHIKAANDYLNGHNGGLITPPLQPFSPDTVALAKAVQFGHDQAKKSNGWQEIAKCPPAPYKWVNVVFENAAGELQLLPHILYRLPSMRWMFVGDYLPPAMPSADTFRYYSLIPELPNK